MRRLIPLSTLLACGPLAPSTDLTSTTDETTTLTSSGTTTPLPDPTTTTANLTTTTMTSTTEPTSSGTTLAHDFIIKPDGGGSGTIECDVFRQDCRPGQKCAAWADDGATAWNATKCVEVTGDGAPGEPCTAIGGGVSGMDDCAFGAMCWDVDQSNHGTCIALCTGAPEAPQCLPGFHCPLVSEGVLNLCFADCDPLLQDCPADDLCIPGPDYFTCTFDASGDLGKTNDPCEFANACDPGLMCLDTAAASSACQPGSTGCCQPFCKFPNSPCPNPDQQCIPFFDPMQPIPPGYESVGICAIPT